MSINKLYYTWTRKIKEMAPELRKTQIERFTWLTVGIFESRSVNLSRVSGNISELAQRLSTVKRVNLVQLNYSNDWMNGIGAMFFEKNHV